MDDDVKFGKLHFQKRCENHPTSTERHRVMKVLRKPKLKCDFDRDEGDKDGRLLFQFSNHCQNHQNILIYSETTYK